MTHAVAIAWVLFVAYLCCAGLSLFNLYDGTGARWRNVLVVGLNLWLAASAQRHIRRLKSSARAV